MCIAILKTKNGIITDSELREAFKNNPDGAGIAYTKDNKLIIEKGIFKEQEFVDKVREIEKICDNNMLIHCRIGTSGKKDELNTHPFFVNENVALMHNGILSIYVPKTSKINDTQIFIKKCLKNISTQDLFQNKCIYNLIFEAIGRSNKFVLLNNKGEYKIINEKAGHWKDDVWYSNKSYEPRIPLYPEGWADKFDSNYFYGKQQQFLFNQKIEKLPVYNKQKINNKLKKLIDKLQEEDFALLDEYPVYDELNNVLIPYEKAVERTCEFLEDVSPEMYEYYINRLTDVCSPYKKAEGF